MSFASTLKDLLNENAISQARLASAIGFSQRAVSKWINAQAEPTETAIISCAQFFGISIDEMLGVSDIPAKAYSNSSAALPLDETELLEDYRALSYTGKARVVAYADLLREQESGTNKNTGRK